MIMIIISIDQMLSFRFLKFSHCCHYQVFEYFASYKAPGGEVFMTPADLMRAIVPVFPPSEATRVREGCLKGECSPGELQCAPSEFFMLFDTDNDGYISFAE